MVHTLKGEKELKMEFTPITQREFDRIRQSYPGGRNYLRPIVDAIYDLAIGSGLSTPCIWKHDSRSTKSDGTKGKSHCYGIASVAQSTSRESIRRGQPVAHTQKVCRDGILYVLRVGGKGA